MEDSSNRTPVKRDYVGNKLRLHKENRATRILFHNIGGLSGENKDKFPVIQKFINKFNVDVLCLSETSLNDKRTDLLDTVQYRSKTWKEQRYVCTATNHHFDSGFERQWGGVAALAFNEISHRIHTSDNDPSGLGRWTSFTIRGKAGITTRFVSAYRPCKGTSAGSVNIQHHQYLSSVLTTDIDPRDQFMSDITAAVLEWQSKGEKIILCGDMNTGDKTSLHTANLFWEPFLSATGLVDAHKTHLNLPWLPATHNRGSAQIDYIFVSPNISIKRAGFLPFYKLPSDHRAIWIDIDSHDILGLDPPPLFKFSARKLKLNDPRIVSRYISYLEKILLQDSTFDKLKSLYAIPVDEWNDQHQTSYNQISAQVRLWMLEAESYCRKIKSGAHPWSIAFDRARKTKFLWEMVVKWLQGILIPMKKLLKLKKKLQISTSNISLEQALIHLKMSVKHYRKVKRKSHTLRQSYLESIASALSISKNTKKSAELRALQNREDLRSSYRKLAFLRSPDQSNSLSSVTISNPDGSKSTFHERSVIEPILLQNNKDKFHQTSGYCPLMKGSLRKDFGLTATTPAATQVLEGTYIPPIKCRKSTKSFLKACTRSPNFSPHPFDQSSLSNWRSSWKKVKEKTSSGKAHFGHYKAGASHDMISELQWMLSTLPMKHGFSPPIWQQATDVMILKKAGISDLDKLRTIVLYEADYNFMNKRIGRQMMDNASHNKEMAEEQYAKPGCSSIDQCLSRRMIFDLVRLARSSFAMCSSDLKSCYDRIVHSAASLAMQKFGLTRQEAIAMFTTIQECKHKVRTSFGDSEQQFCGTNDKGDPMMGSGQGNGAGPAMWTIISCVLFIAMHAEGLSTQFISSITKQIVDIVGFMYVDDMDLIKVRPGHEHRLISNDLQIALDYWNKLVRVTGGALVPEKSNWYGYYSFWDENLGNYTLRDTTGSITTKNHLKVPVSLAQLSYNEPQLMLGHTMSPDCNSSHQVQVLCMKSQEEAHFLSKGKLLSHEAKLALNQKIIPKLRHPLVASVISQEEGKKILRPSLTTALNKMGIVSTLGYDYIYGSVQHQGLGITDLFHWSHTHQLESLLYHRWRGTQTGKLMTMEIEQYILELGTLHHVFDLEAPDRLSQAVLTPNLWIHSLRDYIRSNSITVRFPQPIIHLQRQNDRSIMDFLSTLPVKRFGNKDLQYFNFCRLYKKVRLFSDIIDNSGTRLSASAYSQSPLQRNQDGLYPTQHMPTLRQWKSWRKGLQLIQQFLLSEPHVLGLWLPVVDFQWDFFLDPTQNLILRRLDQMWMTHSHLGGRWISPFRFSLQGDPFVPSEQILSRIIPISADIMDSCIQFQSLPPLPIPSTIPTAAPPHILTDDNTADIIQKIQQMVSTFPDAEWALHHMSHTEDLDNLIRDYISGTAKFVGDGSYKEELGYGASSFLVASGDGSQYIMFRGPTPGSSLHQSPYRSELGSLLGCAILNLILTNLLRSPAKINIACDCEKALRRVTLNRQQLRINMKHVDLISRIIELFENVDQNKIHLQDVTGHADQKKPFDQLSILEKLNIKVDLDAKSALSLRSTTPIDRNTSGSLGLPFISHNGSVIPHSFADTIQSNIANSRIKMAGIRNKRFTESSYELIDFMALSTAMKKMSVRRQIFVTKWIAHQLPVGSKMVQRKQRLSDICPFCQTEKETSNHIYRCRDTTSLDLFSHFLEELQSFLQDLNTHPMLTFHLIESLRQWRRLGNPSPSAFPSSILRSDLFAPFSDQSKIGWDQFMEGLISSSWSKFQHKHYTQCQDKRTGAQWASKLIYKLWDINFRAWTARNEVLHSNSAILEELHGKSFLDDAIDYEFSIGIGNLHRDFSLFFTKYTIDDLKTQSLNERLTWFKTIRTAREASGTSRQDHFSVKGPLRSWIGLG